MSMLQKSGPKLEGHEGASETFQPVEKPLQPMLWAYLFECAAHSNAACNLASEQAGHMVPGL
jgi:hypothetical protein